jgi:hypothetical protein
MLRVFVPCCWLVAFALLTTGCEQAKTKASQAGDVAKKAAADATEAAKAAAASAKEAAESAKNAILKGIEDGLPKVEEKIKGLSGDAATKAKEKFEAFKKLLGEFKSAAPDKWEALKSNLVKEFDDLKKLVGMEK